MVVVDHKTDVVARSEIDARMGHYRLQGAAYSLLIRQATGRDVKRVEFVFLTARETRTVENLRAIEGQVRELVGSSGQLGVSV